MMKQYTYSFFKKGYPEVKKKKDSFIVRYFYRPISFFASSIAANCGLTANQLSFLSISVAVISSLLYFTNSYVCNILGTVFVFIWIIMDCMDGNLARSVKKQSYGDFADATSSYILINFLFICLGLSAYNNGGLLFEKENKWILIIGAFAASFDSLSRLIYQKFKNSENELVNEGKINNNEKSNVDNQKGLRFIYRRLCWEVSLGGLFLPALIVCTVFEFLDLFICFYALLYFTTFIGTLYTLVKKVLIFNSNE